MSLPVAAAAYSFTDQNDGTVAAGSAFTLTDNGNGSVAVLLPAGWAYTDAGDGTETVFLAARTVAMRAALGPRRWSATLGEQPVSVLWQVPRESTEWVGPITVTLTADGLPTSPGAVQFAVLPKGTRPGPGDWVEPYPQPGGTGLGVLLTPVTAYQQLGIWVRDTDNPEVPVLDPASVATIIRT